MNARPAASETLSALQAVVREQPGAIVVCEGEDPRHDGIPDDRVWALPIADRAALGVAVGAALGGRPVVFEAAGTRRLLALLEVLADAAAATDVGVPLVVRVPYGDEAGEPFDAPVLDLLVAVPGLRVVVARDGATAAEALRRGLRATAPTVLLEPRVLDRSPRALGTPGQPTVREGGHAVLVTWGAGVAAAVDAAEALAAEGLEVAVVDGAEAGAAAAIAGHVTRTGRLVVGTCAPDADHGDRLVHAALRGAFLHFESPPACVPATADAMASAVRDAVAW